jgi:hypothetical protein
MTRPRRSWLAVALVFIAVGRAWSACGDLPGDAAAVAAARAEVDATCQCGGPTTHGAYVRCAAQIAGVRVRRACRAHVLTCATRSTCGRPGAVTCCRTDARGQTRCSVTRDPARCKPPRHGTACVGVLPSCCDACSASGCATTTTTTTTTTATTLPRPSPCTGGSAFPLCGGSCAAGEVCQPHVDLARGNILCACFPQGITACTASGYPQCGGVCPEGNACQAMHVLAGPDSQEASFCACVNPAATCGPPPPEMCGSAGVCPPGSACTQGGTVGVSACGCSTP